MGSTDRRGGVSHDVFSFAILIVCVSLAVAAAPSERSRALRPEFVIRTSVHLATGDAEGRAAIVFNRQADGAHYALEFAGGRVCLVRFGAGAEAEPSVLAGPVPWPGAGSGGGVLSRLLGRRHQLPVLQVLIKRRRNGIRCLIGGVVLETLVADLSGGTVGIERAGTGAPTVDPLRVQPLAPITFADDFMRGGDESDPWTSECGTWALDELPNATWSPNAFRYLGRGEGLALASAGAWFWDDYSMKAAVRPSRTCGAAGLAFYVQSSTDCMLLRWRRLGAPDRLGVCPGDLELVMVSAGMDRVCEHVDLALDPEQWTEFGVAVEGALVTGFVDGRALLHAWEPAMTCGGVGLYCRDSLGTRFDDVAVASLSGSGDGKRRAPRASRAPHQASALPKGSADLADRFRTDQYMQQWASELGSWVPDEDGSAWHLGFFPGDFDVSWVGDYPMPFGQGPLVLVLAAGAERGNDTGYRLTLTRSEEGVRSVLVRAGQVVLERTFPMEGDREIEGLSVSRRDGALELRVNDGAAWSYLDPDPIPTRRLGVVCAWQHTKTLKYYAAETVKEKARRLPALQDVAAVCPQLRDYLFHGAPVDWYVASGTWEVTPRWICLPHFSWLGGRSHEHAAFLHKHAFSGDVTLDVYAAVMMNYGPMSGYDRYGDLNVTICADGKDLSSGYTAQFGAEGNTVTRLWRGDEVVAENREIVYPPRSQGAHQNWYHLTLEKRGDELRFLVDNQLACSFSDPAPLTAKRIALWTWNRGIMIGRCRIWADEDHGAVPLRVVEDLRPRAATDGKDAQLEDVTITSSSHPAICHDFTRGLGKWRSAPDEYGASVRHDGADGDGGCLVAENVHTGGDFSIPFPFSIFDAGILQQLSFDYRLSEDVRLNLYFRTRDRWHVIGLNGPLGPAFHQVTESREISGRKTAVAGLQFEEPPPVVTGQATVEADDRWHSVRIHLLQALEMLYPGEAGFVVTGLHLANWSNAGYRQCGFGGNRAGASCRLDNVMLGTPGGADVRLGWQGEACGPAVANWSIRGPSGSRGGSAGVASRAHIRAETSGTWLARVTPVRKRGNRKRERTVQHRFWVDADAPSVVRTEPGPGVAAAPSSLSLLLVDRGGSGVDSAHVSVRVAGTDIARDALRLDGNAEETHLRIALGGLTFADGESVSCEVHARDRAGNEMAMPHRWSWTFRTAEDVLPPSAPRLVQPNEGDWEEGFEQESWEWGRFPGSAWAEAAVDDSTAATGDHCLRVSGGPGPYRCFVRRRPFDVEARPVLTFQYLADPGSTWDIGLRTDRGWSVVSVNGGTRRWRQIGRMRRHRADGKWQQAVLPIGSWLKRARAYDVPVVEAVAIVAARGMRGGQPTTLRVDDMRLGPLVYAGGQLGLAWSCDDVGGVSGYGVTVDRFPATEPPEAITTATASLLWDVIPERQLFFHCRGRDRAGNWGAIRHTPLVIRGPREEEPPELVRMSPEDGARTAAEEVELRLRDRGSGVSVESVVLWVDKQRYALGSQQLAFQRDRGDLLMRWRGTRDDPAVPVFGKGDVVQCRLSVADYAGNRWPEPRSWSWEVDPAMDRDSPAPPHMVWRPADALVYNGFEEEQRHWIGRREGWAEVTPDHAATGRRAIRLGGFSTFMQHTSFDVSRHPVVAFQYCLPAGATMNLMIRIENRNWEIRFNSDRFKYPCIGRAEGVVADGTWRGCRLDIAKMLPNATVVPRGTVVDHLATLNRSGGSYLVDDFCIGPATPSAVRVQWAVPSDASGIRGYSLAVDTSPDTVPDVSVETVQPFTVVPVDGTDPVFVHCRAVDGAGNAGGAAHLRISP